MYQSPQSLQTPAIPLSVLPNPRPTLVSPPSHSCHELLTELLICVIHSELNQENTHEQQD